jgi:hypothetical protein
VRVRSCLKLAAEGVEDEAAEAGCGHDGLQGFGGGEGGARDHAVHGAAIGGEAQAA